MSHNFMQSYRCYLIDHHSPNDSFVDFSQIDFSEYEKFFQTAHADSMMVYCKDHWGLCYYPTAHPQGKVHPTLGQQDFVKELADIARRNHMEFVAYYCLEYDVHAARSHPQWQVVTSCGKGLIRDDTYAKWPVNCLRTGYGDYCMEQLEEIVSSYHPDAVFLDIFGASLCYCPACRDAFVRKYGYELPQSPRDLELHREDLVNFLDETSLDYLKRIKERLKAIDPTLAITTNFASHYPETFRRQLDYQFAEPILQDNWFSSAYTRDTAKGRFPIMMPGEFSAVYNYPPVNRYITDLSEIAAQGCRVGMYSGSMHVDGSLEMEEARRVGAAFREIQRMHPYLSGNTPVRYAGILQDDASLSVNIPDFYPDATLRLKQSGPHLRAILGAMKLCEHAKLPWNVVPSTEWDSLEEYPLLLLPELFILTEPMAEKLRAYVKQGGTLVCAGHSGLYESKTRPGQDFSIADLLGVHYLRTNRDYKANGWSAYLSGEEALGGLFACPTTPPVSDTFLEVQPETADCFLRLRLPCVTCDADHWVNWWSPPPGGEDTFPAGLHNSYGKGSCYYFSFDFFSMSAEESFACVHDLFGYLLRQIKPPIVSNLLEAPDTVRTAFSRRENGNLLIHQISQLPRHFSGQSHPLSGGYLRIKKSRGACTSPEARLVYPSSQTLSAREEEGFWNIKLPDFELQQLVEFSLPGGLPES